MNNEQEIAKKIVATLEANVDSIDAATAARLQSVRLKAIAAMTEHQHAVVEHPVLAGFGRVADFSHHAGFRFWLPVLLLLAVLMAMLGSMAARNSEPIDTDALLLASDLPPEAFADKEFVAWLENTSHL